MQIRINGIFLFAHIEIIHYLCGRNDSRWGMWAGLCLPFVPATIFQDIITRRLLALVLEIRKLENFSHPKQESGKCPLVCLIRCVPQ